MKKVFVTTLVCMGILLLLSSAAVAGARTQAEPASMPELTKCNGGMCLFTIAPGKTALGDALTTFKRTAGFVFADYSSPAFKQSVPYYRLYVLSTAGFVNEIDLTFPARTGPTAGMIVAAFGWPCGIEPDDIPGIMVLKYPGMILYFPKIKQREAQRFEPSLPLSEIHIFDNGASCERVFVPNTTRRWRGFSEY